MKLIHAKNNISIYEDENGNHKIICPTWAKNPTKIKFQGYHVIKKLSLWEKLLNWFKIQWME